MSYEDLTPWQLRELLAARDAHIEVMIKHIADAEQRLAESPLVERTARDLFIMVGHRYVSQHDDKGQLPVEMLQQIATDCWVSALLFSSAGRRSTPPVEGRPA